MVTYSTAHRALVDVGRAYNVPPTDMRLLVRLAECGGQAYTDELEDDFRDHGGSAIRRSSLTLRHAGFITADHGPGTDRTRRGHRARFLLTDTGHQVVAAFHHHLETR